MDDMSLRHVNVSLVLENYEDLFSDFDPRGYGERALSQDFLDECRRSIRDHHEKELALNFLVPTHMRNETDEANIRHRLKSHFQKHAREKLNEVRGIKVRGVRFFIAGAFFMMIAAYLYGLEGGGLGCRLLLVIFEPAGWFSFWTGLDQIFFTANDKMPDAEFYRKAAGMQITFSSYKGQNK